MLLPLGLQLKFFLLDVSRYASAVFFHNIFVRLHHVFSTFAECTFLQAVEVDAGFVPVTIGLKPVFVELLQELSISDVPWPAYVKQLAMEENQKIISRLDC